MKYKNALTKKQPIYQLSIGFCFMTMYECTSNPHRLPEALREEIDSQITELREKQFKENSYSSYAAPLVPVL